MNCPHCGQQIANNVQVCPFCGKFVAQQYSAPQQQYSAPQQQYGAAQQQYAPPRPHIEANRSWIKIMLLSMVTCGIYGIIEYCKMTDDVNTICRPYDNQTTQNYFVAMLLGCVTCGIYPIIWIHNFCNRIGANLKNRGIASDFSASTFWLWGVLGSLLCGVGPIIFAVKMIDAINQLAADYNNRG